jgi:hypothetical protein
MFRSIEEMLKFTQDRRAKQQLIILFVIFVMLTYGMVSMAWGETKENPSAHPPEKVADLVDVKEVNPHIIVIEIHRDNFTKKSFTIPTPVF